MLAAVVRETQAASPDLWRCYLGIIVDGLANERSTRSDTRSRSTRRR
jgi:hypothetical protein